MSGVAEALVLITALIDLLQVAQRFVPQLSAEIQAVTALVRQAQAENRDLNSAEMLAIKALVDSARDRAVKVIADMP